MDLGIGVGWVRTLTRILSEQKGYDDISAGFVSEDTSRVSLGNSAKVGKWRLLGFAG